MHIFHYTLALLCHSTLKSLCTYKIYLFTNKLNPSTNVCMVQYNVIININVIINTQCHKFKHYFICNTNTAKVSLENPLV